MVLLDVSPDPRLELCDRPSPRAALREHRAMHVLGGVAASSPDDDRATLGIPLEDGPGPDTQAPPDLGRNRDLPLCGQLRLGDRRHDRTLPRSGDEYPRTTVMRPGQPTASMAGSSVTARQRMGARERPRA